MSFPDLTDRLALARHRSRAERQGFADFLHWLAADEIEERLKEVNRTFTAPVIVTGHPAFWANWQPDWPLVSDDEVLALDPGSKDLVIHAMSLHWASDPVGQLIQCRRALRPDGLLVAVGFGGRTLAELRASMAEAEAELTGGLSPRVAPMAEIRDLGALLQRAGLALPVADVLGQRVLYRDLPALCHDLRAMGETNALAQRLRQPLPRRVIERAGAIYREHHSEGDRIVASFDLVFLTGWAPHPGQQQPLRPGSAISRLADALGTTESNPEAP